MKPSVHGSSVSVVPRGSSDAVQLLLEQSRKKRGGILLLQLVHIHVVYDSLDN